MAEFPTFDEMAKNIAEKALDDILYDGKSIREWMQIIVSEDCISRKEVCNYIAEFVNHEYATDRECEMVELIISGIQHLPSIQPKTGHWIQKYQYGNLYCSECNHEYLGLNSKPKYCEECGAKMLPTDAEKEWQPQYEGKWMAEKE